MKIFKAAITTTALATVLIASGPMAYAMDAPIDQSIAPSKTQNFPTNFEEIKFELQPTGLAQKIETDSNGKTKVLTRNNADADYQLESTRFPVTPGQKIQVPYDITVEEHGAMSIGLLNSNRNGWYGTELILNAGSQKGLYERIVPELETETSLVFRNYHLGVAGETTFTINDIQIRQGLPKVFTTPEHTNIQKDQATDCTILRRHFLGIVEFEPHPTNLAQKIEHDSNGKMIVTTRNNADADYQLVSNQFNVTPGNHLNVTYNITVEDEGIMSLGFLGTSKTGWYGEELILKAGHHQGIYYQTVPEGESYTNLVFRNYHLGTPGQTTFTINDIQIQQVQPKSANPEAWYIRNWGFFNTRKK